MTTENTRAWVGKLWKPLAGVVGLGIMIAYSSGSCREKVQPGSVDHRPGLALPAGTTLVTVKAESLPVRTDVVGTVASEESIHLSARLSAYVKEVSVSAGSEVKKGQVLMVLDGRDIQEQLTGAEAQLKQAETEYLRAKQLLESKATTDQAFVAAESAFNGAKAQVERMKVMLGYTQITSPIDGVVTDRRIEAGDLANPGQVLLAVYNPRQMRLDTPVPVRLVDRLKIGQEVEVKLDRPRRTLKGKVGQIVSEIDSMSRTQLIKVNLEGEMAGILPGAFGRLYVEEAARPMLLVPATAVYRVGQLELVQVVEKGRVIRRYVRTGSPREDRVEILSGLAEGEAVVVKPLKEG